MKTTKTRKSLLASFAALFVASIGAYAADLVNTAGASGIALDGYDPVAFFTDHKPVHGDPGIKADYQGATYLFASKEHRRTFEQAPEKYAPQCGGYCAYGAAVGALFPVDINTWQIVDGKLYLNLNPEVVKLFNADLDKNLSKAAKNWPKLVKQHAR